MEFFGTAIVLLAVIGFPLLLVVGVVLMLRRGGEMRLAIDPKATYFYVVSLAALLMAFFALLSLTGSALELALHTTYMPESAEVQPGPRKPEFQLPPADRYVRERIAQTGALVLVALPVWLFHWRGSRRLAFAKRAFFSYRLYLYGVMTMALIAALVWGGMLLAKLLGLALGTVDWTIEREGRLFWKDALSAAANLLVALGLWAYHWRLVERVPAEETEDE